MLGVQVFFLYLCLYFCFIEVFYFSTPRKESLYFFIHFSCWDLVKCFAAQYSLYLWYEGYPSIAVFMWNRYWVQVGRSGSSNDSITCSTPRVVSSTWYSSRNVYSFDQCPSVLRTEAEIDDCYVYRDNFDPIPYGPRLPLFSIGGMACCPKRISRIS